MSGVSTPPDDAPLLDASEEDPSAEATAAGAGYAATSAGEGDAPVGPPSQDVAG